MCSLCKHAGQWGQFTAALNGKKAKKSEPKKKIENAFSELRELNESLEIITQSTQELKSLDNLGLVKILNKFKLPVSPCND